MRQPDALALDAYLAAWREECRALGLPEHELVMPPAAIEATARCLAKAWAARTGWTRLSDALPPDDGRPFELRLDDMPDVRSFVTWRSLGDQIGDREELSCASLMKRDRHAAAPTFVETSIWTGLFVGRHGCWRLLPDDRPPEPST